MLAFDGYLGARYPEVRRVVLEAEARFAERGGEKARSSATSRGSRGSRRPRPGGSTPTAHCSRATHQEVEIRELPDLRDWSTRPEPKFCAECGTPPTAPCPTCGTVERGRSPSSASSAGPTWVRRCSGPSSCRDRCLGRAARRRRCCSGHRRAAAGIGPVRGPGGVHDPRRGPGSGGVPRAPEPLFEAAREPSQRTVGRWRSSSATRSWRCGACPRPRGRCRTRRAGRAGPGRGGRPPGRGHAPGASRRPDRGGGRHRGRDGAGHRGRGPREHGLAAAVGGPPGSVLVGEPTYHATREPIRYEEAGEQLLKGKTAPVSAWRASRVLACGAVPDGERARGPVRRPRRRSAPREGPVRGHRPRG